MAAGKKYVPTKKDRDTVYSYTQVGITQEDIAKILEINLKTLRKHYRSELDKAAVIANAQVGGTLFRMATSGEDPAATIFWGKTKMGLRERDTPIENRKPTKLVFTRGADPEKEADTDEKKNGTE